MVHSRVTDQVSLAMHVVWRREANGDRSDLVSDLQVLGLARVRRMEGLVVGKSIDVEIVLLVDFLVALAVGLRFEAVKEAEEDLESDETVGAGLMLRTHPHDVQLLRDFVQSTIQVKAVHERFDVEHVRDVVFEVLFEELAS